MRRRFVGKGLDGLVDEARPGGPRRSAMSRSSRCGRDVGAHTAGCHSLVTLAMAAQTGLSKSTWTSAGVRLKPHLVDTFKLSTDPLFIEKVRDVVGCM